MFINWNAEIGKINFDDTLFYIPSKKIIKVDIKKHYCKFFMGPKKIFDCYPISLLKCRLDSLGNTNARELSNFLNDNYNNLVAKINFFFSFIINQ